MAVLEGVVYFLKDHPSILVFGFLLYCLIFYISVMFTKAKPGKNPFQNDCRKDVTPLVHDKAIRDKVLKQGFTHKKIPENIDVIVVGSGISGMTSAALLAKAGKKVLVLEQHDQAGGCCHSFVEKGFEFDAGIHYVGEMQHRTLGRTLFEQITDGQVEWAPLKQNFDTVAIGKPGNTRMYPLLSGKEAFKQSIIDSFPEEKEAIDKFFQTLKKARGLFMYFVMLKSLPVRVADWIDWLGLLHIFTDYGKFAKMSTQDYLDSITDNKDLKAVLAYCYGDYATIPAESNILMHSILVNHFSFASSYPVGGASEIAMRIIPVIEKTMGRVLVRANVTDILIEKGRAVGVRVSKGDEPIEIRAKQVISAAGVPNTLKLLPEETVKKTSIIDLVEKGTVKSGVAVMSLFVGLDATAEELGLTAQNLWAFIDADLNAGFNSYAEKEPDIDNIGDVPLLFISFPSTKDPTWSEKYPGKTTCAIITLANYEWFQKWENEKVKHRGDDYEELKEAFTKKMWSQCLQYFPQLEDKVAYMELGSPLTDNYYIRSTKGEAYGLDHNIKRFRTDVARKLRPKIGIPGLYLTGQDIMLCGFSGGMFSGLLTASAVLHRDLFKDCQKLHETIKKGEKAGSGKEKTE